MNLRDRCQIVLQQIKLAQLTKGADPVEMLEAFVTAEIGRSADDALSDALPLALYFAKKSDREDFVAIAMKHMTGARMVKLP